MCVPSSGALRNGQRGEGKTKREGEGEEHNYFVFWGSWGVPKHCSETVLLLLSVFHSYLIFIGTLKF